MDAAGAFQLQPQAEVRARLDRHVAPAAQHGYVRGLPRELDDRRQALLDELARLDTTEQRSAQIRGALGEINFILDLPEGPLPGSPDDV